MRPDGNSPAPLRVIVSGGIGSGKSTVLQLLAGMGAMVIEADRIGHQVLEPGGAAFDKVAEQWPAVVVEGRIVRSLLAAIVFNDVEQLALLESLTHPAIRDEIAVRVAAAGSRAVALELPLQSDLAGPGWTRIVIDAPAAQRIQRAVARGMPEDDAARRLAVQPDRAQWLAGADLVIDNSGSLDDLERAVAQVWESLESENDG